MDVERVRRAVVAVVSREGVTHVNVARLYKRRRCRTASQLRTLRVFALTTMLRDWYEIFASYTHVVRRGEPERLATVV